MSIDGVSPETYQRALSAAFSLVQQQKGLVLYVDHFLVHALKSDPARSHRDEGRWYLARLVDPQRGTVWAEDLHEEAVERLGREVVSQVQWAPGVQNQSAIAVTEAAVVAWRVQHRPTL